MTKMVFNVLATTLVVFMLSSCSLFNVDLNTGVEPLPSKELNTRILLHEFANDFSVKVEHVADSIIESTDDLDMKLNALHWKINAISMSRQVIFQTVPYASLVDTWTFCKQQSDLFGAGPGSIMFQEYQGAVQNICGRLESEVAFIAKVVATSKDFESYQRFVDNYAATHPLSSLNFSRGSLLSELNEALGYADSVAVTTVGTMPEAVSDLSSRLNDYSNSIPKLARWKTQAYLYESGIDSVDVKALMDSINMLTSRISYIADNSPELVDSAIIRLNEQLTPLINQLDDKWSETLWKLEEERKALMLSLDDQRILLTENMADERAIIMQDLNVLSKELVEQSWVHVKELIVKSLFLILIILLVMLGLPFGLGFFTGRLFSAKKAEKG